MDAFILLAVHIFVVINFDLNTTDLCSVTDISYYQVTNI